MNPHAGSNLRNLEMNKESFAQSGYARMLDVSGRFMLIDFEPI